MSVSLTGSSGSKVFAVSRRSSFSDNRGTSNPLDPNKMDLQIDEKDIHQGQNLKLLNCLCFFISCQQQEQSLQHCWLHSLWWLHTHFSVCYYDNDRASDTLGCQRFSKRRAMKLQEEKRNRRWENLWWPATVDWSYHANRFELGSRSDPASWLEEPYGVLWLTLVN